MSRKLYKHVVVSLALLTAAPALAGPLVVSDAWFRSLPGNLPSGGYFTLHNNGAADVQLSGAQSSACGMLMLHQSMEMNGVSKMADVTGVTVPAGGSISFAPGGYHLMCMNPAAVMKPGAHVPVTLDFADGSKLSADFLVKSPAGR